MLPVRLPDYSPAWLDELTIAGEVVWSGNGVLPGGDGWVSLHLAGTVPLTLAEPTGDETTELQRGILAALAGAVISTLASVLNSASTLFTMDLYRRFLRKGASQASKIGTTSAFSCV